VAVRSKGQIRVRVSQAYRRDVCRRVQVQIRVQIRVVVSSLYSSRMLAVVFKVRRQISTELVVIFEVAGVSARDLVSSYSSTMLAIGLFLINFVH